MACATDTTVGEFSGFRNRLGLQKSPYLLQHANNPVDWYPWGQEAFDKAQRENKPIFLSVGYSTCHWCHVMERESFENDDVGRILNENFVSIKVDREERPDVDKVYMTFIQATQGSGGWPMSVWLTPDLKPIVGGTYFPPEDRYFGQPGFKTLLASIAEAWQENRDGIQTQGNTIVDALLQATKVKVTPEDGGLPHCPDVVNKCYAMLARTYDPKMGGFGKAPKFPQPVNFEFMFRTFYDEAGSEMGRKALQMTLHTLRMMAKGGMHDHLAQGFHRYSTDNDWHVPHFEKMLYDQAQLTVTYVDAYQISKDKVFADVARDILSYVNRDLSDQSGGFYSAEDADSFATSASTERKEGAFCVWTYEEVQKVLGRPVGDDTNVTYADVFCHHYDVKPNGNVNPYQDPHDELKQQNVLIVRGSVEQTAGKFELSVDRVEATLQTCREELNRVRALRPRPHLDTKMLTSWNGLMISAFARAGQVFGYVEYTQRALKAVEFLRSQMYVADKGVLLRSCYINENKTVTHSPNPIEGFVDDYAMLIRGLLDLYEAAYDDRLLQWAERLQGTQDRLFWDTEHAAYFTSTDTDPSIVLRLKEDQDGAEPSANSVSAYNLLRLSCFLDRPAWTDQALKLMAAFSDRLTKVPIALPEMVGALMFHHSSPKQIIIRGDPKCDDTLAMLHSVHSRYQPHKVVIVDNGDKDSFLHTKLAILSSLQMVDGKATAYVCQNQTCSLPVNSVDVLDSMLAK